MSLRLDPKLGATVLCFSAIDERHNRTGEWAKTWGKDFAVTGITQVAVCKLPQESGVNLLCLDGQGHVILDSAHESISEARAHAEREYRGLSNTWQSAL